MPETIRLYVEVSTTEPEVIQRKLVRALRTVHPGVSIAEVMETSTGLRLINWLRRAHG